MSENVPENAPQSDSPLINDAVYDNLKFLAQVVLPGLGTLYFALSQTWGWAYGEQVLGTIAALDAFLGLFLVKAKQSYMKSGAAGIMHVAQDNAEYASKKQLLLKVHPVPVVDVDPNVEVEPPHAGPPQ